MKAILHITSAAGKPLANTPREFDTFTRHLDVLLLDDLFCIMKPHDPKEIDLEVVLHAGDKITIELS